MSAFEFPFQNPDLGVGERADDLLSRLTTDEKIHQLVYTSPAIERLGIPEYNWWNECLHGVSRAGISTVFPQGIAQAATFDEDLQYRMAEVIADEARAKHHANAARGDRRIYKGLTFWSPNINIFRDPRWGRGQETYGECPYLTGRLGMAFVRGLQGDDPRHLKLVATPKHYAVHSGPEAMRHAFDARVSQRDLWETYLPAFRMTVVEAGAWSVMGAYNRTNGEVCCGSRTLLLDILRGHWGFQGYVVSDCGAVEDFHEHHEVTRTPMESAALAVRNGCDLCCGRVYTSLREALKQGLITESEIDVAARRLMIARIKLGMFDPPATVKHAQVPIDRVDAREHRELSRESALKSIVLLRNEGGLLPLGPSVRRIAVIGPNADDRKALWGNYTGLPSLTVTPLEGIRRLAPEGVTVVYQPGCHWVCGVNTSIEEATKDFTEAIIGAERADVVVLCLGLTADLEGEQGDAMNSDAAGDRLRLGLPDIQEQLLHRIVSTGRPVVLVLISGSALSVPFAARNVRAIIQQFYPGQEGGTALAQVLFGHESPAGRMPVTVYRGAEDLPDFEDYAMEGRTYRFFEGEPLYPFGFGLSYTHFAYAEPRLTMDGVECGRDVGLSVSVQNTGAVAGDEVVQVYASHPEAPVRAPLRQLVAFRRIRLEPGEKRTVDFRIAPRQLALFDDDGSAFVYPGTIRLHVGGSQPDMISRRLGAPKPVEIAVRLTGQKVVLPR